MTSPTLKELQEQLVNVNLQIQIEEKRMHGEAVTTVRELVRRFELTPEEVFDQATPTRKKGAVKAKYRDPASGATWTGRGIAPAWIRNKNRDAFLIR